MENCSVLVCSCDKYEDAWNPFFTLLKRNWSDCPYPIYLNTETKTYEDTTGLNVKTLNSNPKYSWSKRLKNCLRKINSKYIIVFLEDFFLLSIVRQDVVAELLKWMDEQPIAQICFDRYGSINNGKEPIKHNCFIKRKRGARYTINLQVCIWRKDVLLKCLTNFETPWEFEEMSKYRSCKIKKDFYVQLRNSKPIFDYTFRVENGHGLYRGKWLKSNVELFEKNNIKVNFNRLGFFESTDQFKGDSRRNAKEKILFYAKHPINMMKTLVALIKTLYHKCYWGVEKILYSHLVEK